MTFFEWFGRLAGTGAMMILGAMIGSFVASMTFRGGLESILLSILLSIFVFGFASFIACLALIWGVNLLPFLGAAQ